MSDICVAYWSGTGNTEAMAQAIGAGITAAGKSAASAEYACLVANPTLVVEGDATSAGLSTNMEKRVSMLEEVVADLAAYYPDLKQLGETIAPLKEKVASIQSARAANAEIMGIRDALLK